MRIFSYKNPLYIVLCSLFLFSFQMSPEQRKLYQVRLSLSFGEKIFDKEIYFFNDWNIPNAEWEAEIQKRAPDMIKNARLYFVDLETKEPNAFTKANLNYQINAAKNLQDYFRFRNSLLTFAKTHPQATDQQVAEYLKDKGFATQMVPTDILAAGAKVYEATAKNMQIEKAPSLLIYNLKTHQKELINSKDDLKNKNF